MGWAYISPLWKMSTRLKTFQQLCYFPEPSKLNYLITRQEKISCRTRSCDDPQSKSLHLCPELVTRPLLRVTVSISFFSFRLSFSVSILNINNLQTTDLAIKSLGRLSFLLRILSYKMSNKTVRPISSLNIRVIFQDYCYWMVVCVHVLTVCLGSTHFLCLGQRLRHATPLGMT